PPAQCRIAGGVSENASMAQPESESAAMPPVAVEGRCDRAVAPVQEAFYGNFRERGELLREEIAGPLRADVHIGLPACEHARAAQVAWPGPPPEEGEPAGLEPARLMVYNAYFNPGGLSGAGVVNSHAWRAAEVPRPMRMPLPAALPASTPRSPPADPRTG